MRAAAGCDLVAQCTGWCDVVVPPCHWLTVAARVS
jgi:hypothetical protein